MSETQFNLPFNDMVIEAGNTVKKRLENDPEKVEAAMLRLESMSQDELKEQYSGVFAFLESKGKVEATDVGYMNMFLTACMEVEDPFNDEKSLDAAYTFVQKLQTDANSK